MIPTQTTRTLPAVLASTSASADTNSVAIDTKDAQYVEVALTLPTALSEGTSTIDKFIIQTSESTNGPWVAVATGDTDFDLPTSTDETRPHVFRVGINKGGGVLGRYIRTVTEAATGYLVICVSVTLDQNARSPSQTPADFVINA